MNAPALRLIGITKRFGSGERGVTALARISLEVGASERLVVLGASGSGKTTLLRLIAGLETPDAGQLEIGGRDAATLAPAERDVALVFQNFSLYPHLSVRENLAFPLRAPGRALPAAEITHRVDEAAAMLRITRLLDRPAKNLSGGEMQRVAIGRAIVRRPRLFLLDEPLTNLDAKLRESLRVELVSLFRKLGVPVIYVTHDQAEALSMADRVAVLAHGRVLQIGTPSEVYLAPASPEVARQLGQPPINLIEVERRGDAWHAPDGTTLFTAADAIARFAPAMTRALLGLRPEHLALVARDAARAVPATIEWVEDAGPYRVIALRALGRSLRCMTPADASVEVGATVGVALSWSHARLWAAADPAATGEPSRR